MKTTIRVIAGSSVVALLAIWWGRSGFAAASFNKMRNLGGSLLSKSYFKMGTLLVTPMFVLKAAIFLVLLALGARLARSVVRDRILVRTSIDRGLQYALSVGTGYLIFFVGLTIGLQSLGLNLSSIAFLGGAIGLGIGVGLQPVVNNFVSGLILLVERPIKVGDRVEIEQLTGDVVKIAARSTWVRTNDNVVIIVPNSEFTSHRVTNWTANDRRVRITIPVGASYSSDPENIKRLLLQVAAEHPDILADPAPDVMFAGFGDSSLDFELRVWTTNQVRTPHILKSDLYFSIFRIFQRESIEIPFPQRDLHLRSVSMPIRFAQERTPE